MKKILNSILISFVIILSVFFVFNNNQTPTIEMMIKVSNEEEAITLSNLHDIELMSYSDYGFATYSGQEKQKKELIQLGFEIDHHLYSMAKFNPSTSDPFLDDQYALNLMSINEAWTLTEGSIDVVIAIIDTGIDTDHEEFSGRILQTSYNSRTKTSSETNLSHIEDDNGHGTMVAGIIAANKNNSKGIAGIVQESKLLVIKANNIDDPLTESDESEQFSESSIAEGIHYAREHGADVINLSLGTKSTNTITKQAVDQAIAEGIIIIGASGNDGDTTKYYPASYEGVISVGSVNSSSIVSTFSNYNNSVDISAPGESIVTTSLNNGYVNGSGTSFAAPQVTGVIALMLSYFKTLSSEYIINQLIQSSTDRGIIGYDDYYGYGIVNAAEALDVSFVTISFETFGGTPMDPVQVISNYPFEVLDPIKDGYQFMGWYKDSFFQTVFLVGVDTVTTPITLYAKYQPSEYTVTLVVEQAIYQTIQVYHGDILNLSDPEEPTGYDFTGWFYDMTYQTIYSMEPINQSLTLYAKFEPEVYTINYYNGLILYDTEEVSYQEYPKLPTPIGIYTFIGWYYDSDFVEKYELEPVTSSFSLYARFNNGQYTVTFFDYDLTTVLSSTLVYYGFDANPPSSPDKPSSPSFSYQFINWSEDFSQVKEDLSIYPIYEKTYLKSSVYLLEGIDTVQSFDLWEDAGISLTDPLLTLVTEQELYLTDTYKITYSIYDEEQLIDVRYRMVSIISKEDVVITIHPGITTLLVNQPYIEDGATISHGTLEVKSEVNTDVVGVYEVIYRVNYNNQVFTKIKYVYVLDKESYHKTMMMFYRKEEGWWLL